MLRKLYHPIIKRITLNPSFHIYIHLKDHDIKINPKQTKLNLSYMDPKNQTVQTPTPHPFKAKLKKSAQELLQRKIFEDYKQKILQGIIDQEEIIEPDQLWGDSPKPIHYYKALSNTQIGFLTHSVIKDVEQYQQNLVREYLGEVNKISNISQAKDLNDLALLATSYRLNNEQNRQKYFEIEKAIGNKFHLLSDRSLILLKYAFMTAPKQCTPEFNQILTDLIHESLQNLTIKDLVFLMYFNRFEHFKFHGRNLQLSILDRLETLYSKMSLQEKIDFLLLYVDSRGPTIRRQAHNRHYNEIRNKTQEIICLVNLEGDFSSLPQQSVLKLAYVLVRSRTNKTEHLSNRIVQYVSQNIDQTSTQNLSLFFIYLSNIEGGKSIGDLELLKQLKQKIIASWAQLSPINQIRTLDSMLNLKLYDQKAHQLYQTVQITADNTMLGYFCRLEMMNSSGRQWEVLHRLADLEYLPLHYYQDYKRFCNYVNATAPDWDIEPIKNKLVNSEIFFNSERFKSGSMDKSMFSQIKKFQDFSNIKVLPKPFKIGCPINNLEFGEFALPQYQISVDIVTDVEKIRGTKELKGSYEIKIRSLENIGWKHLYVFLEDVEYLTPLEFFDHIYKLCEPHFEEQMKIIASYDEYRSYEIEQLREQRIKSLLKPKQLEKCLNSDDFVVLDDQEDEFDQKTKRFEQQIQDYEKIKDGN